jgi:hypothetical protein
LSSLETNETQIKDKIQKFGSINEAWNTRFNQELENITMLRTFCDSPENVKFAGEVIAMAYN